MSTTKAEKQTACNENRNRLSGQQYKAIRLAAAIDDDIRNNYPGIALEYRSGLTAPKLVELVARHGFDRRYGVGRQVAINAVRNVLRGYVGCCYEPYDGLIADRSEREYLASAHNRQTGLEVSERKLGIHALTRALKVATGRKGGLIRGPLSHRLRIGCHALPLEVLREHCRRIAPLGGRAGGVASVLAKGQHPYAPATPERVAEVEYASCLATDPCYLGPVRANFRKIADIVNAVFHSGKPHYTRTTLKIALQSHRRHNRSATESTADPEMCFAESLTHDPAYQCHARVKAAEIARKANEEYHGGRPVRNSISIRSGIRRYREQNASPIL